MDKRSDTYVNITDNSISVSGSQNIAPIVPMLTVKGKLGKNRVTAQNYKQILGYDVSYNSNYFGLGEMLSYVSYIDVWRMNQNCYCGNAYLGSDNTIKYDKTTVTDISQLETYNFAVMQKDAGYTGDKGFRVTQRQSEKVIPNIKNSSGGYDTVVINDVNTDAGSLVGFTGYEGNIVIYDSSNTTICGVVKSGKIYPVSYGVVATKNVGTVTKDSSAHTCTIALTSAINANRSWVVRYTSYSAKEWTLSYGSIAKKNDTCYFTSNKNYDFSLDSESDVFVDNVDFGDIEVVCKSLGTKTWIGTVYELKNGTNGSGESGNKYADDSTLDVTQIDVEFLKTVPNRFLFLNGFQNEQIINAMISRASMNKIHTFVDAPAKATYEEIQNWLAKISKNEYVVVGAKPEEITIDGKSLYVYPSVKYCQIYADMLKNHGSFNYPPAGKTYGVVTATNLLETDYDYYGDEMKTDRVNYLSVEDNVICMWEQRTQYALDSDLSYIAPTFILDDLVSRLVSFERNFNFRYQTASELILQEEGLTTILDNFVDDGFLYEYELVVPTAEEANNSRELDVYIGIKFTKDSEVINLNIALNN